MAMARRRSTTWRRARCAASTAGTAATRRHQWSTSRASQRAPRARGAASQRQPTQPCRRRLFDFPIAASSGAPPTWPAPSTPRAASCSILRQCLEKLGLRVVTVDLATSGKPSPASVHPREVARHHPRWRARGVHQRSRQRRQRDGDRVRALHAARGATSAASSRRRRLGRHDAGHARRCARCRSAARR